MCATLSLTLWGRERLTSVILQVRFGADNNRAILPLTLWGKEVIFD